MEVEAEVGVAIVKKGGRPRAVERVTRGPAIT